MSNLSFEESKSAGAHRLLARMAGNWQGVAKTWFEPGKLADESPIAGSVRLILDGRFAVHEYSGSMKGKSLTGMATFGSFLSEGKFQMAWVDSFHMGTGILMSESTATPCENSFSVLGHYSDPSGGPPWGWRTQVDIVGPDELVISHFNVFPQGEEALAVEIRYARTG
ncbi:MAG TPA: DUF1579 domain-containing protein [Candidatus Nitrosotenuis sp.]|nr:DUF1579 domain-containing protein [Candidatus Nitrosotenuis sp.]